MAHLKLRKVHSLGLETSSLDLSAVGAVRSADEVIDLTFAIPDGPAELELESPNRVLRQGLYATSVGCEFSTRSVSGLL